MDSQLAKQSSLTAVSEILNGCMCEDISSICDDIVVHRLEQVLCPGRADESGIAGD